MKMGKNFKFPNFMQFWELLGWPKLLIIVLWVLYHIWQFPKHF